MSEIQAKAAAAERLANDPMLLEALANIRHAAITAWEQTSTENDRAREFAWLTVKVVNRIEAELQSVIDGGKIAAARIQAPLR